MKKTITLIIFLVIVLFLTACSSNTSTNDKLVLSQLSALDENTLKAEFNDGSIVEITDFTPKPLLEGEKTEVTFIYNDLTFSKEVTFSSDIVIKNVDFGFAQNGSISVIENNDVSSQSTSSSNNEYLYVSGQSDDENSYIKEINTTTNEEKIVKFDGIQEVPAPYPTVFYYQGLKHILFGSNKNIELYKFDYADDDFSYFLSSTSLDFSQIKNYMKELSYKGDDTGWIMSPEYNEKLGILYFTIGEWVYEPENNYRKEYIKVRIYKSLLNDNNQFSEPIEVKDELDPYNGIYYKDGNDRTIDDYPQGEGLFWLGRLYITENGDKAYFTQITNGANEDMDFLVSDFPFMTYNINSEKERITMILSAEIDSDGNFYNIKQMPYPVNQGGVNFLYDISPDGKKIYVGHMKIEDDFFDKTGWGPDGMVQTLIKEYPWKVPPWNGDISEIIL